MDSDTLSQLVSKLIQPIFFGAVFATLLFGITCVQTYRYISRYVNDSRLDKSFALGIWFLDTLHLSTSIYIAYSQLVSAWNHPQQLVNPTLFRIIRMHMCLDAIMISYAYTLYGRMTWKLSCNVHWTCTYFMMSMILAIYGVSIFAIYEVRRIQARPEFFAQFAHVFGPTLYILLSLAAAGELIIGIFICHLLRQSRSDFTTSRRMFATDLSHYLLASGLLASIFQIVIIVTCVVLPNNFAWFAVQMVLPSILGNSYLALMNARKVFRHGLWCKEAPNMPFMETNMTVHVSTLTAITRSLASSKSEKGSDTLPRTQPVFSREVDVDFADDSSLE
ncbi:hypothetical protein ONZ45_g9678 [Pleurotus djamor]|nr:hypothetical protein ONZ45_g9678 [Pleurotus djamor]